MVCHAPSLGIPADLDIAGTDAVASDFAVVVDVVVDAVVGAVVDVVVDVAVDVDSFEQLLHLDAG